MIVITMTCCPPKLRGDLSKWLLEINTGVYVGQVSARVREALWNRVCENISDGQATMVYSAPNEQHMKFLIHNSDWIPTDYDGITLIKRPLSAKTVSAEGGLESGFSNASKQRIAGRQRQKRAAAKSRYVFLDLETTGLNPQTDSILEIGAVCSDEERKKEKWSVLIKQSAPIPPQITELTGITNEMCQNEGVDIKQALRKLRELTESRSAVFYNSAFDLSFLRATYQKNELDMAISRSIDVLPLVKRKLRGLLNNKLETVARHLGFKAQSAHRASNDSELLSEVFFKLNEI